MFRMRFAQMWVVAAAAAVAWGQVGTMKPLLGKFHVHHLQAVQSGGAFQDLRSIGGSIVFDGSGNYTFTGMQMVGASAESNYSASGTYLVSGDGSVRLTNPQRPGVQIQAKSGRGMIVGSSVEAGANTYDLFVGVPAVDVITEAAVSSDYWVAGVEFVNSAPPTKNALPTARPSGKRASANSAPMTATRAPRAASSLVKTRPDLSSRGWISS